MPKTAIYPGSFDPITNGHIDVIERAASIFDEVIVLIGINSKKSTLFNIEERLEMSRQSLKHLLNVSVEFHSGLTVDFAELHNASVIIRGVRAVADFEFEYRLALMNRKLNPEITTMFLMPHEKYTYVNSGLIREIAAYGRDTSDFVPKAVSDKLKQKFEK